MVLLWLGIKPKTDADGQKLARGLTALRGDDPGLSAKTGGEGTTWLGAENEDRLEVAADRLKREFEVEAAVTRPHIAYKEALTQAAEGAAKYLQRADGRQQYAHVKLRVAPGDPGSGYVFENAMIGSPIPDEYMTAIEEGVALGVECGALAGYPIHNVRVAAYDGSYHETDSSADAFRHAARLAFADAARRAGAVLLEPIMDVDVVVPFEYEPAVSDGLLARRAEVFGLWPDDASGSVRVTARAPLSEMFGYRADLQRRTQGRATFSMSLAHFAPVTLAGEDGDPDADVTAPLRPRTPLRTLRASVPEQMDDSRDSDPPG